MDHQGRHKSTAGSRKDAAGGVQLLPPAAPGDDVADRPVDLGGGVVDEVHNGNAALHQKHPRYSRPWGSCPRQPERMLCASAACFSASAPSENVTAKPSLLTLVTPGA